MLVLKGGMLRGSEIVDNSIDTECIEDGDCVDDLAETLKTYKVSVTR